MLVKKHFLINLFDILAHPSGHAYLNRDLKMIVVFFNTAFDRFLIENFKNVIENVKMVNMN